MLLLTLYTLTSVCLFSILFVKDIEQKNSFLIRSIINYFVCLVTIVVTMFIFFLLVCNRIF